MTQVRRRPPPQPVPTPAVRRQAQPRFAQWAPGVAMADADLGIQLFVSATTLVRAVETHIQQRYCSP
jgi:hypothetical protein